MWLSLLAALLRLFNVFAEGAAKSGAMDAGQALLIADVIQSSLKRIELARALRRAYRGGSSPRPDTDSVLKSLDRSRDRESD